nr:hypothetical protein [Tanacetum cinerariifolium]
MELMDKRKKPFAKLREEEKRRKPPTKAQKRNQMCVNLKNMARFTHRDELDQERSKKQKLKDDKESEELKRCLEIIPDDGDDVTIDATPLSIETPIIDIKIYEEGKKITSTKVISASASMSAIFEKATSASISIATAVTTAATTVVSIDDITLDQALVEIKTSKPKAKGVVIQEPKPSKMKKKDQINFDEQEAKRLQAEFDEQDRLREEKAQQIEYENLAWDNVQAMIDADYKLAARLQAEVQEQLTIKESSRLFVELMDKRKKHFQNLEQKRREENLQPKLKRGIKCVFI